MKFLFIHQNFPAQFKNLAERLASDPDNFVVSLSISTPKPMKNVRHIVYKPSHSSSKSIHPLASDFETKVIRGSSAYKACLQIKEKKFLPDIIFGHPGWGEMLFVKEVWPEAKIIHYCEYFYRPHGQDVGFDSNFPESSSNISQQVFLKNAATYLGFDSMDLGISPTKWQKNTYPKFIQNKIVTLHEGIKKSDDVISSTLRIGGRTFNKNSKIVTFAARNLEPCRGYHQFLKSIPHIQKNHPDAIFIIVGGTNNGYGPKPPNPAQNWKDYLWEQSREHIQEEKIIWLDFLPYEDYKKVLYLSTAHIYLTYPFVLSWSLIEAMSMGCCIVGSNTGPVLEVIKDQENGLIADFFNPENIAAKVNAILSDEHLRQLISENAKKVAFQNYDFDKVIYPKFSKILNFLKNVKISPNLE